MQQLFVYCYYVYTFAQAQTIADFDIGRGFNSPANTTLQKAKAPSEWMVLLLLERKSYIDRISSYGFKCEGEVSNGHLWFQIKGYGFKAFFAAKTIYYGTVEPELIFLSH